MIRVILPVVLSMLFSSTLFAVPDTDAPPPAATLLPAAALDPNILSPFPKPQPVPIKPKSELARILDLSSLLKTTEAKIIYKGNEYEPRKILGLIRLYIYKHYKKEKAEDWLKTWAHKSRKNGHIYYVKYPNGKTRLLRDVLLEGLNRQG